MVCSAAVHAVWCVYFAGTVAMTEYFHHDMHTKKPRMSTPRTTVPDPMRRPYRERDIEHDPNRTCDHDPNARSKVQDANERVLKTIKSIYVVSTPGAKDRHNHIAKSFKAAVEEGVFSETCKRVFITDRDKTQHILTWRVDQYPELNNQIAVIDCYMGHKAAFGTLVANNEYPCMVVEDDLIMHEFAKGAPLRGACNAISCCELDSMVVCVHGSVRAW